MALPRIRSEKTSIIGSVACPELHRNIARSQRGAGFPFSTCLNTPWNPAPPFRVMAYASRYRCVVRLAEHAQKGCQADQQCASHTKPGKGIVSEPRIVPADVPFCCLHSSVWPFFAPRRTRTAHLPAGVMTSSAAPAWTAIRLLPPTYEKRRRDTCCRQENSFPTAIAASDRLATSSFTNASRAA